jgi:hypothetical protein
MRNFCLLEISFNSISYSSVLLIGSLLPCSDYEILNLETPFFGISLRQRVSVFF